MNEENEKPVSADQFGRLTQELLNLEKEQIDLREKGIFVVRTEAEGEKFARRKSESPKSIRCFEIPNPFAPS